jgi:hypothetical protein
LLLSVFLLHLPVKGSIAYSFGKLHSDHHGTCPRVAYFQLHKFAAGGYVDLAYGIDAADNDVYRLYVSTGKHAPATAIDFQHCAVQMVLLSSSKYYDQRPRFASVWKETLILLGMTVLLLALSLRNFKIRLQ